MLIHLAWGGLPNYPSLHHFERELPAHYALLKRLVDEGLSTLVVAGTCFEYGMQSGPLAETLAAAPANPYALAKDALRRQLQALQRERPFALTWARLFYLYGEGQAETALWPQLRRAVESGAATFPMSGGEQLRDYLPVELRRRSPRRAGAASGASTASSTSARGSRSRCARWSRAGWRRTPGRSASTSAAIRIPPTSRWRSGATPPS